MMAEISARLDRNIDSLQRDFLLAVFLYMITSILAGLAVFMGRKRAQSWFGQRVNVLVKCLSRFGRNDEGDVGRADARVLEEDPDWSGVFAEIRRGEQGFRPRSAAETALSKCLTNPFVVFSPQKKAVFWNSHASRILDISARDEVDELGLEEFFNRCVVVRRKENFADLLRNTEEGKEITLQFHRRSNNEVVPVEVSVYPLQAGALKGGFVVLFRDMKEEEKRITDRLLSNYKVVDRIVDTLVAPAGTVAAAEIELDQVPVEVLPIVEKMEPPLGGRELGL